MPPHSLFQHFACLMFGDRGTRNVARVSVTGSEQSAAGAAPVPAPELSSPVRHVRRKRALVLPPSDDEKLEASPKRARTAESSPAVQQQQPQSPLQQQQQSPSQEQQEQPQPQSPSQQQQQQSPSQSSSSRTAMRGLDRRRHASIGETGGSGGGRRHRRSRDLNRPRTIE
jgi:hypothetical protein